MSVPARVSQLEQTIRAYRQALLKADNAALAQLQTAYAPSRDRLLKQIERTIADVAADGEITAGEAAKLARTRELLRQVEVETARLATVAGETIPQTQQEVTRQALERARVLTAAQAPDVREAAKLATQWAGVNTNAVADLVGTLGDGSPLNDWLNEFVTDSVQVVKDTLIDGVARGIGPEALARALAKATDLPLHRAMTLSRTETMRSYRSASLRSMQANSDIIAGYERSASLSVTSCAACIATAGNFYPLSHPFEEHPRGRCSPIPVLKDAPLLGHIQTGPEWFAEQPAATQKAILGPGAYEAFSRGEIQLQDMAQRTFDEQWGGSIQRSSLIQARASARQRRAGGERRAAR
jgi:hypothetical protein